MSRFRIVPNKRPVALPLAIIIAAALAVALVWPKPYPTEPSFRVACDLHGGIVVQAVDGAVCIWAGAVIPIEPGA
jgi:hypothetical protein